MSESLPLQQLIIAAGQQAGLFLNKGDMNQPEPEEKPIDSRLAPPVVFTLRPVEEYRRPYRGGWTQLWLEAVATDEVGAEGQGVGLDFEAHFALAYAEGDCPDDPAVIICEMMTDLDDFVKSHPAEAARLFEYPLTWEMTITGEIIYELAQRQEPILDFGMYPVLKVTVVVYETADVDDFEQALATLSDGAGMGRAIQEMMQPLALLFRWLDMESPPRPPRHLSGWSG